MTDLMIISALILLVCITSTKVLYKFGVPILLVFMVLGMIFVSDGLVGIYFDNYDLASNVCSIALIFIMFYGGFGTNWSLAKPVATKSILMSSLGVVITSGLTGVFCYYVFNTTFLEGLLIGAIVGSTDAASVFAILRSQKINLKDSIASLLEVESGSNDPFSYMLTMIILGLMVNGSQINILSVLLTQLIIAIIVSVLLAKFTVMILHRTKFEIEGFYPIFITAIAILSYSLAEYFGGNGYLSVYIAGIIIGNSNIANKSNVYQFFDGLSWLMQILLFFLLGLLAFPSQLPSVMPKGVAISLFMIFVARPVATFSILSWFKVPVKQQLFISWVGIRGAASIVFAIFALTYGAPINNDIFHIIFFVALFSVTVQGGFLAKVAKKLDLIDNNESVLKTFNDYSDDTDTNLVNLTVAEDSLLANKAIKDINIFEDILIVMIKRNEEILIPNGSTIIKPGDILVLTGNNLKEFNYNKQMDNVNLLELTIDKKSSLLNKKVKFIDMPKNVLLVIIKRNGKIIIPKGNTKILENDTILITSNDKKLLKKINSHKTNSH